MGWNRLGWIHACASSIARPASGCDKCPLAHVFMPANFVLDGLENSIVSLPVDLLNFTIFLLHVFFILLEVDLRNVFARLFIDWRVSIMFFAWLNGRPWILIIFVVNVVILGVPVNLSSIWMNIFRHGFFILLFSLHLLKLFEVFHLLLLSMTELNIYIVLSSIIMVICLHNLWFLKPLYSLNFFLRPSWLNLCFIFLPVLLSKILEAAPKPRHIWWTLHATKSIASVSWLFPTAFNRCSYLFETQGIKLVDFVWSNSLSCILLCLAVLQQWLKETSRCLVSILFLWHSIPFRAILSWNGLPLILHTWHFLSWEGSLFS